jgi:hypothetical protein
VKYVQWLYSGQVCELLLVSFKESQNAERKQMMKKTLTILLAVVVLGLFISQTVLAQPGPGRGEGRGRGQRGDGQGRGFRQDGGRFGRVDPVELMQFLQQHEPKLAETLNALRENDLRQYRTKMFAMMRLYGPAMRQMERNPEIGQLVLKRIRLSLEIEQKVKNYNGTQDKIERKQIKTELKQRLSSLFDTIIFQEEKRLDQWQQNMQNWADQDSASGNMDRGRGRGQGGMGRGQGGMGRGQGGMGRGQGGMGRGQDGMGRGQGGMGRGQGGMGRGQGGMGRGQGRRGGGFQGSVEERKKLISIWHDQKEAIVNARATELLQVTKPFPWR